MKRFRMATILAGAILASAPATAQRSNSEDLLTAIRDNDSGRILSIVETNGPSIVNMRGYEGGTALTMAAQKRNMPYVQFLLGNKADPNLATRDGETPLVIATRLGWIEGVQILLSAGAHVDGTNKMGETPLILAVHSRNTMLVRRFMEAGADADKTDRAAGMSAREYAKRDNRVREILRLIETVKPATKPVFGPSKP